MSMVQQAIEVGAPLRAVYEQITAFENYPRFMTGVERVTSIGADRTHWVMDLDGRRREFDALITERSLDQRVSWSTTEGPLLAETITLRPVGETRTQVVAQLEADIAFLMPGDRHGEQTLHRRLKDDLTTLKVLVESGVLTGVGRSGDVGSKQMTGRSSTVFGGRSRMDPASPASVAARVKRRTTPSPPSAAGWGTSTGDLADLGTAADGVRAPGSAGPDVAAPGRRLGGSGRLSGGVAGTKSGSAPMGGRAPARDLWGDGMINEADRGGAYDY
jgi:hypothetical protein